MRTNPLGRLWHALRRDEAGASAVEFALLLPVLVLLLFGSIEVTQAVTAKRKVALVSSSLADLVTRVSSISASTDLPNIWNAGTAIITPFDASKMSTTISSIKLDNQGNPVIDWSRTPSGTGHAANSSFPLPAGITPTAGNCLIVAEVTYTYKPLTGYVITGSLALSETSYLRPRTSACVALTS